MNKSVVFMQHFLPCDKLGSEALETGPGIPAAQAQAQAQDIFLELILFIIDIKNE
jgi:hypothetical protein